MSQRRDSRQSSSSLANSSRNQSDQEKFSKQSLDQSVKEKFSEYKESVLDTLFSFSKFSKSIEKSHLNSFLVALRDAEFSDEEKRQFEIMLKDKQSRELEQVEKKSKFSENRSKRQSVSQRKQMNF